MSERLLFISTPRTASNLFVKILNLDAQGVRPSGLGGYFFMPASRQRGELQRKPISQWTEDEVKSTIEAQQECFDKLQDYIEKAEEEKQLIFVKEHAALLNHPFIESAWLYGQGSSREPTPLVPRGAASSTRSTLNKTCLSDEFLATWKPTFLIRHPAMIYTSMFRIFRLEGWERKRDSPARDLARHWQRALYDFYDKEIYDKDSDWPIILDADDIMIYPELLAKYARIVGFNEEKLIFSWDKATEEEVNRLPPQSQVAVSYLNASNKVDLNKVAGDIDIAQEAAKWREEFGEEDGAEIERLVQACMPDYEYMRSKRLTID